MSVDDDVELRDLMSQTLEMNGCLSKIRAQLRASIFLTLDEDEEIQQKEPLCNTKVKSCLETYEGRIMFCLVREFLEFFNLDFTVSVFDAETYVGRCYSYGGRCQIIENLDVLENNSSGPLLLQLINIAKSMKQDVKSGTVASEPNSVQNDDDSPRYSDDHSLNSSADTSNSSANVVADNLTLNQTYRVSLPEANSSCNSDSPKDKSYILENKAYESVEKSKTKDNSYSEISKSNSNLTNKQKNKTDKSAISNSTSHFTIKEDKLESNKKEKSHSETNKSERSKSKSSTSHASDLPLQINKSKCSESQLLPSLYSIGKDKTNLKEIDKLLSLDESLDHNFSDESVGDLSSLSLHLNSSKNISEGAKKLQDSDSQRSSKSFKNSKASSSKRRNETTEYNLNNDSQKLETDLDEKSHSLKENVPSN